jgi:hypothetical protein
MNQKVPADAGTLYFSGRNQACWSENTQRTASAGAPM